MPTESTIDLDQMVGAARTILAEVISRLSPDPENEPAHFFALCHAKRLFSLAGELDRITEANGMFSPPVIARTMLESLFKLGIASGPKPNRLDLVLEKAIQEFEWGLIQEHLPPEAWKSREGQRFENIRKLPAYRQSVQPRVDQMRKKWRLAPVPDQSCAKNRLSIARCSEMAGLEDFYEKYYRELSKAAHVNLETFVIPRMVTYSRGVSALSMIEAAHCLGKLFPHRLPSTVIGNITVLRQGIRSDYWTKLFLRMVAAETLDGTLGGSTQN